MNVNCADCPVGVDGAAAGQSAHDGDPALPGVRGVDFLEGVLELPDHEGRRGAPHEEDVVGEALFRREIQFRAEVEKDVVGTGIDIKHDADSPKCRAPCARGMGHAILPLR